MIHYIHTTAASRPIAAMTQAEDHMAPRVLTLSFRERLSRLTAAEREIRAMGYAIAWTRLAGETPELHLRTDDQVSMVKMLDRLEEKTFLPRDEHTLLVGRFMGCQVSWLVD